MQPSFLKFNPYNFVPFTRTPWGGQLILKTKKQLLRGPENGWPERVGESWEVSTDKTFPSSVKKASDESHTGALLSDVLAADPTHFLGDVIASQYGSHCPLLLKWLSADDMLSVQVHPHHDHAALSEVECGKPESWLVLDTEEHGYFYLGFREGISQQQITDALREDRAAEVLHKVSPKIGDYVSIPPGCVHATGPGVLIAEPQYVLPGRSGKTWRLSDWGRRYNSEGKLDPSGQPRELHVDAGLSAVDWSLPRGKSLETLLIHRFSHQEAFHANKHNPFAAQYYSQAGLFTYNPLVNGQFSLATCWKGQLQLISEKKEHLVLNAGESGLIAAGAGTIELALARTVSGDEPSAAFFSFAVPEIKGA